MLTIDFLLKRTKGNAIKETDKKKNTKTKKLPKAGKAIKVILMDWILRLPVSSNSLTPKEGYKIAVLIIDILLNELKRQCN